MRKAFLNLTEGARFSRPDFIDLLERPGISNGEELAKRGDPLCLAGIHPVPARFKVRGGEFEMKCIEDAASRPGDFCL